jgi:hypothetical protein
MIASVRRTSPHVTLCALQVLLLHVKRFALRDDKIVKISQPLQVAPLLQVGCLVAHSPVAFPHVFCR